MFVPNKTKINPLHSKSIYSHSPPLFALCDDCQAKQKMLNPIRKHIQFLYSIVYHRFLAATDVCEAHKHLSLVDMQCVRLKLMGFN